MGLCHIAPQTALSKLSKAVEEVGEEVDPAPNEQQPKLEGITHSEVALPVEGRLDHEGAR